MRTLKYNVSELPNVIIPLGMQGERNALTVQIDLTEWADDEKENEYGVLIVMNPDGVRYGAATEYDDETHILSWQLGQADTGTYGNGAITVDFWSEGTLTRSVIARTHMLPSYYKGLDPAPDPYEVWLETMSQHSATAGAAANSAKASAEAAAQSEAAAAQSESVTSALVETVKDAVIGQAVLTEKIELNIAVMDWTQAEGGYVYTIERSTITPHTFANICIDESILELTRCIEWQTAEGALTLTTERLPTDTISGYIALITTFEDGDETKQTTAEMLARTEEAIEQLEDAIEKIEKCRLTEEVKEALLACFTRVAWIGDDGQAYYDALEEALNHSRSVTSISAVFNQGSAVIYDTTELNDLRQYLTVTATYSDDSTKEISNYALSGTLTAGTSTITATYEGKTATFNVTVTHKPATLQSISASFNQGSNVVYDDATLDSLRQYLTVTAHYSDSSSTTVTGYTLSGTLTAGTSTITATYEGKTATFNVTVTHKPATLQSISASFNQGSNVVYDDATLDSLKQYLTVTAHYSDGTTKSIDDYTLSGTLTAGTSTITATYEGKTATFNVTVTHKPATLQSISASFNQGSNVVYDDATLDSLKQYLTVTAHYSDGTTAVVTEYTLSGSLSVGTSTITATHEGLTDTFTVVVTAKPMAIYRLPQEMEFDGKTHYDTGVKLHENDIDYTVTIDFSTEDNSSLQRTILHCMHEASPYHGLIIDLTKEKARVAYSQHNNEVAKVKVPYSEKIVITHAAGSNAYKYYRYNSNEHNETGTIDYNFVSISESIWLGSYRTTAGSPGRYFIGTISDFVIYNYAWTEEEANAYLQEDHS